MIKITITHPTLLKSRPLQSENLDVSEKIPLNPGTEYELISCDRDRNHWRLLFPQSANRPGIFFVYEGHCKVQNTSDARYTKNNLPESVRLNVFYRSQLDNFYNPTGSCNVTSIAMCLDFLKVPRRKKTGQYEDELYQYAIDHGYSRHSPQDLARIVRDYGSQDRFTEWATIEGCQKHLASGNPCVFHGYFTSFGHILVAAGYDKNGFLVHDPYGEWFPTGYDTTVSGAYLHYSYDLIRRTCMPDGQFWVHHISA
ncbi:MULTISPECIES: C39 family peptidase [unclassified Microcoleus]|uniref:C39 family peptidase n=1 Tax=unclassified Microcoleus TaxID=2642155 RepID=UPI001D838B07|nr:MULTISPECIES: C39 family peptidase [unclassified Microcoleus]MCC3506244.1 C39 family peptidase [Microcoleus sp. PH2017_19_SFW_U_A]MCC3523955.1 C39 family peptidase [Microcoleus sp. PH2017_20_SFW_D_A]MCC3554965.1 C39 family peptidase [Microcoleus sp. PH2017_35_SFW_U_B]MCC3564502.1 C39 family peptidase [Microcoleus sp. PH2017_31_RDM_U_A]MCC3577937.1 C39 family peptidase [Microcoleus sp. PH2017_32_RDM_D_A]